MRGSQDIYMNTENNIETNFDDVHLKIIDALQPFYGANRSEVVRNLVIRWIEQNTETIERVKTIAGKN